MLAKTRRNQNPRTCWGGRREPTGSPFGSQPSRSWCREPASPPRRAHGLETQTHTNTCPRVSQPGAGTAPDPQHQWEDNEAQQGRGSDPLPARPPTRRDPPPGPVQVPVPAKPGAAQGAPRDGGGSGPVPGGTAGTSVLCAPGSGKAPDIVPGPHPNADAVRAHLES